VTVNLSGVPSLGTMSVTRGGIWRHTYRLHGSETFPPGTISYITVTDRGGGEVAEFEGTVSTDKVEWLEQPDQMELVEDGHNFEVFVVVPPEGTYKVQYGRVVRHEARYPLRPTNLDIFDAAIYEDTLNRQIVGPNWIAKKGKLGMHPVTADGAPVSWALAVRNNPFFSPLTLWEAAGCIWYAPARSDSVEVTVGLLDGGNGYCTIVLASNVTMTKWLGVRFRDAAGSGDNIQVVLGTGPTTMSAVGSTYSHIVPDDGQTYRIRYDHGTKKVSVYIGASLEPVLEYTDTSNVALHGLGYRYYGAVWNGSFDDTGPLIYYWKAVDV
jgi:hypothetical protein